MARARRLIAASIIVAISLTVIGCSAAATPDWTFTPGTGAPPADAVGADRPHGTPGTARPALAGDLEVEAFDLGFQKLQIVAQCGEIHRALRWRPRMPW